MNYVYRVKRKYLRNDELLKNGFSLFKSQEGGVDDKEKIYALGLNLSIESDICRCIIGQLNDEKIFSKLTEEDFSELRKDGIEYGVDKKVILNDKAKYTITKCQLCVTTGVKDETAGVLFLNGPDEIAYYNADILDNNCKNIINVLKQKRIIYRKLIN